jgi:hypothetical protein
MERKNEAKIKIFLSDTENEFCRLSPNSQAKFAIEQISIWQSD